jgi:hypothetical protein
MFVYIVGRNSTFLPKAYEHISITFAFQLHLVNETEKNKVFLGWLNHSIPFLITLLSPVIVHFLLMFLLAFKQIVAIVLHWPSAVYFSLFTFFYEEKPYDIYCDTENIYKLLLKDCSDEEELLD